MKKLVIFLVTGDSNAEIKIYHMMHKHSQTDLPTLRALTILFVQSIVILSPQLASEAQNARVCILGRSIVLLCLSARKCFNRCIKINI